MTTDQDALHLADLLERDPSEWGGVKLGWKAATELRRLYEANAELLAAISKTVEANLHLADGNDCTLIDLVRVLEKNGATV